MVWVDRERYAALYGPTVGDQVRQPLREVGRQGRVLRLRVERRLVDDQPVDRGARRHRPEGQGRAGRVAEQGRPAAGRLDCWTYAASQKARNLARDPGPPS